MRKCLAFALLLLFIPGCLLAALGVGAAAGILVHETYVAEDSYQGIFRCSIDQAYDASLAVMDDLAVETTHSRSGRWIKGQVGDSDVSIQIRPHEQMQGEVRVDVTARKNLMADRESAIQVFQKISRKLTEQK